MNAARSSVVGSSLDSSEHIVQYMGNFDLVIVFIIYAQYLAIRNSPKVVDHFLFRPPSRTRYKSHCLPSFLTARGLRNWFLSLEGPAFHQVLPSYCKSAIPAMDDV